MPRRRMVPRIPGSLNLRGRYVAIVFHGSLLLTTREIPSVVLDSSRTRGSKFTSRPPPPPPLASLTRSFSFSRVSTAQTEQTITNAHEADCFQFLRSGRRGPRGSSGWKSRRCSLVKRGVRGRRPRGVIRTTRHAVGSIPGWNLLGSCRERAALFDFVLGDDGEPYLGGRA